MNTPSIDYDFLARLAVAIVRATQPATTTPTPVAGNPPLNPSWQYLSPLTLRIVRVLCKRNWLTKDEIAVEVNEQPEGDIRPLLADLVKRGVLESSPRKGYMIAIPETSNPEEYRKRLLDSLPAEEPDELKSFTPHTNGFANGRLHS